MLMQDIIFVTWIRTYWSLNKYVPDDISKCMFQLMKFIIFCKSYFTDLLMAISGIFSLLSCSELLAYHKVYIIRGLSHSRNLMWSQAFPQWNKYFTIAVLIPPKVRLSSFSDWHNWLFNIFIIEGKNWEYKFVVLLIHLECVIYGIKGGFNWKGLKSLMNSIHRN